MKKVLGILLAVFLCMGLATMSMASTIESNGNENGNGGNGGVRTMKGVMIFAGAFLCTDTAAESDAISVQGNIGTLDGSDYTGCRWWKDVPESYATLMGSANRNAGIAAVNNASGNLNNQSNTVAGTLTAGKQESLAHAVAFAFQGNIINGYFILLY